MSACGGGGRGDGGGDLLGAYGGGDGGGDLLGGYGGSGEGGGDLLGGYGGDDTRGRDPLGASDDSELDLESFVSSPNNMSRLRHRT
jgi:hypothetical protein